MRCYGRLSVTCAPATEVNHDILKLMREQIIALIEAATRSLSDTPIKVELSRPDAKFGDYATNVAMQLAKPLGQNPRQVAEQLKATLEAAPEIAEVSIAGPGFINIRLHDDILLGSLAQPMATSLRGKTVLVEYSDPNPFKPLHAGHLYTTLVGDTIARLVERAGASTIRLNFGGDVGLHVGKCLWAIVQALGAEDPTRLSDVPAADRAAWLGARYVEGNTAYEDDPLAKPVIIDMNRRAYRIQAEADHISGLAQIYWTCRQWSYDYFLKLYDELKVHPFDRYIPESEVTPLGLSTVEKQLAKGVFEKSNGAIIFDGESRGLHTRVFVNSEGLPTYETKDVGNSLAKWRDYHFDVSIIITASEQAQYMQVVIAAIHEFAPEPADRTRHLTHGVVKLQGGVKMSSRKGNTVTALEILESARQAGAATGTDPSEDTILAAVKYAFAKNRIGGDIEYDPVESIALEGNSGPYLQYAHARACSILAKAESPAVQPIALDEAERGLLLKVTEYREVVERATNELMPHHICTYLYELAQTFNRFYEHNRVIGDERQATRLFLVKTYADTLKDGLELLGITAPERM